MPRTSGSLSGFALGAALFAFTAPAIAQLAPLTADEKAIPEHAPDHPPPLNPDPHNLTGSWKAQMSARPNGPSPAFSGVDQAARRACLPEFSPYSSIEGAAQFVQTPKLLLIIFEEQHRIRRIRLNGTHPAILTPSYWGDSIGHWDGDTLVVETTMIKGRLEAGGPLVSPRTVLTERFRKVDGGAALEDQLSYADPDGGKLPPPETVRLKWQGPQKILEWICEDGGEMYWQKKDQR